MYILQFKNNAQSMQDLSKILSYRYASTQFQDIAILFKTTVISVPLERLNPGT